MEDHEGRWKECEVSQGSIESDFFCFMYREGNGIHQQGTWLCCYHQKRGDSPCFSSINI